MRILMVSNILTHYRLPLYEAIATRASLEVIFYSDGNEWYWQGQATADSDTLPKVTHLRGKWIGRTRFTPSLFSLILRTNADVVVKDANGKFALPVTYFAARLRRKPFVLWASMWEHPRGGLHRFTRRPMRHIYRHADAVVTYGRHVSRYVVGEGADPHRTFVSPQAVRFASAAPTADRWRDPVQFLFVGRLEPWKGPLLLLEALQSLREDQLWELQLVGEGSQRSELEEFVRVHGLADRVRFAGFVPHAQLSSLYSGSTAVVIPSERTPDFSEPWSLVVNEAMQAGAVVIASSAVGAVADGLVDHGVTGIVFEEGSSTSLAEALSVCLQDRIESMAISRRGHLSIREYSHENAAQAIVDAASAAIRNRALPTSSGGW